MNGFLNMIKGIFIGAGAIVPGVSSGVLCVIFGIYEKLLDAVLNFFKDIKKNIKFLFPIALGVGIGVIAFSNLLNYTLYEFPIQTKSIFIGLIIGTIPSLIKEVNTKEKFRPQKVMFLLIALGIGIVTVVLENKIEMITNIENMNVMYLIMCGAIMSVGIIVPGVSSTIILMLLGVYSVYLQSIANIYLPVLIPIAIGLLFGSIIVMKLTKLLLEKYYGKTFYTIIGFTIGSIFVLLPQGMTVIESILCILCIILGVYISNIPQTLKNAKIFKSIKVVKNLHSHSQTREKDLWNTWKYSIMFDIRRMILKNVPIKKDKLLW